MNRALKFASRFGCLLSVVGSLAAFVIYPKAPWLFAFALIGIAILVLLARFTHDPEPSSVADDAQRLLDGEVGPWDVDDYEHLNPREPKLRDLWFRTLEIGGSPEEWPQLDEERKQQLRDITRKLRDLPAENCTSKH